jgi:hypothetical protein
VGTCRKYNSHPQHHQGHDEKVLGLKAWIKEMFLYLKSFLIFTTKTAVHLKRYNKNSFD